MPASPGVPRGALAQRRRPVSRAPEEAASTRLPSKSSDERHHLDQHRDRIRPGQRRGDDGDDHVGVAAVLGELLGRRDPEPGDREDPDRHLEDQPHRDQRHQDEAVVVLGPDLDVELAVVEVEEELDRGRQHDEVAEDDAGDEQHRDHHQQRQATLRSPGLNAGSTKA